MFLSFVSQELQKLEREIPVKSSILLCSAGTKTLFYFIEFSWQGIKINSGTPED